MGVMTCSVNSCNNIMCDTYVDNVGYVCYECQKEFKKFLERLPEKLYLDSESFIKDKLIQFRDVHEYKSNNLDDDIDEKISEFFNSYT